MLEVDQDRLNLNEQLSSSNNDNTDKTSEKSFDHHDYDNSKLETFKNCCYEIFATFLFVLVIYFCKGKASDFSFGFFVILVLFEKCSGPHLNPSFTLAFMIYKHQVNLKGIIESVLYIISQVVGAYLGALLSKGVNPENIVYIVVHEELSVFAIIFTEFFFTATLIFVILFTVSDITKPSKDLAINCGIIICWFYMSASAGINISGAGYNPAVLIALNSLAYYWKDTNAMNQVGYIILAELLGGIIAALVFKYIYEPYYSFKHKIIVKRKSIVH